MHDKPFGGNFCSTKAGMAAGTTTTLTTANAQEGMIRGKSYKKAATSNEATPTTDYLTGAAFTGIAAGKVGVFSVCRDVSGNMKVIQGQIQDLVNGNVGLAPWFGPGDNDVFPIGSIHVKVAAGGATWTFGSSNLAGPPANTTITYTDWMGGVPPRPQAS